MSLSFYAAVGLLFILILAWIVISQPASFWEHRNQQNQSMQNPLTAAFFDSRGGDGYP